MKLQLVAASALSLTGCIDENSTYTLYRSSPIDPAARIHIATFDAKGGGEAYNRENCSIGRDLFMNQPGVTVKYWCEKGRFR